MQSEQSAGERRLSRKAIVPAGFQPFGPSTPPTYFFRGLHATLLDVQPCWNMRLLGCGQESRPMNATASLNLSCNMSYWIKTVVGSGQFTPNCINSGSFLSAGASRRSILPAVCYDPVCSRKATPQHMARFLPQRKIR